MATDHLDLERDDVGDRVLDDVRKAARHLQSLLPEVKGRISRKVFDDVQHSLSQLRRLGLGDRRGAPDDQPMRQLTAGEMGFELHLGDQMVNKLRREGYLYGDLPPGRARGRMYRAFQSWDGIYGEPLRQVLQAIGPTKVSRIDAFFDSDHPALGDITPVEVLLGKSFPNRGELCSLAVQILRQSAAQRLVLVVDSAKSGSPR